MNMQHCHCHRMWWWVMRGSTVTLSKLVNISRCLCCRPWPHPICCHRPLLVSLFFLSSCICVFSLNSVVLFLPHVSGSISSARCSVLIFVPWHRCITQHQLLRASVPHVAQHCPSVDMWSLVNLSESFLPCSWQLRVVGPDSPQS